MCATSERKQKTKYYQANSAGVVGKQNTKVLQIKLFKRHWNHNKKCAATSHGHYTAKSKNQRHTGGEIS